MVDVDTIVRALTPVVSQLGLALYDVELSGTGRARILRVMVDRAGGVDLDAIAAATEAVSPLLDAPPLDALIAGPYALEVSSPGLERPLRTPAHYAGAVGETVSVKVRPDADRGARRVRGVVTATDDSGFELVLELDGDAERFAYDDVTQARTVFEWGGEPRRAAPGRPKSKRAASTRETTSGREPVRR